MPRPSFGLKMKIDQRILQRLEQLIERGNTAIKENRSHDQYGHEIWRDDGQSYATFYVSALSILINTFGEKSIYVCQLQNCKGVSYVPSARNSVGILIAAKDDYENGYVFNAKSLIEAEVFDDFLEQSEQLFKKGYHAPAAVVAGCVLEDALKKLCDKNGITLDAKATIDPANVALAKHGVYNSLMQKKVLAMADLRNKAAHGQWAEFTKEDVGDMIKGVRSFMEQYYV